MGLRTAIAADLALVAAWPRSAEECRRWAGPRVRFPVQAGALAGEIDFRPSNAFVLVDQGLVVGFGQIFVKRTRAHLARIIVAPDQRGRAYGTRLVEALLERAQASALTTASLNVDPANTAAIALYARLGFRPACRPDDEPDTTGAGYMERPLAG